MPKPLQVFTRGQDGNLWLETADETGGWIKVPPSRVQVDGSVGNLFSQLGGNRIWRPAFQPLNSNEIFVLGGDGNLWYEKGPWGNVPPNRVQVDGSVDQFWALD